jgi:hypothetical protein
MGVSTPIMILEECDFHGKPSKNEEGKGVTLQSAYERKRITEK